MEKEGEEEREGVGDGEGERWQLCVFECEYARECLVHMHSVWEIVLLFCCCDKIE